MDIVREKTKEIPIPEQKQAGAGKQAAAFLEEHEKEQNEEKLFHPAPIKLGMDAPTNPPPFNNRSWNTTINFFQKAYGNLSTLRHFNYPVQAKLTVGQPNDVYEQEADRVAEEVTDDMHPIRPITKYSGKRVSRKGDETQEKGGNKPSRPGMEEEKYYGEKEAPGWAVPMRARFYFSDEIQAFVDATTNEVYDKSEMERFAREAEDEKNFYEKLLPILERKLTELKNLPLDELEKQEGERIVTEAVFEVYQMCVEIMEESVGGYTNVGDPYSKNFCGIKIKNPRNPFLMYPFWQHERVHQRECMKAINEQKSRYVSYFTKKVVASNKLLGAVVWVASEVEAYRTTILEIENELQAYLIGFGGLREGEIKGTILETEETRDAAELAPIETTPG
jgi:predicted ribosome quality control (RQC) complex YloA/Tae2 family protein